jgi:hypothetical protein
VDSLFVARLKKSVQSNHAAAKRLLLQFSQNFKKRLIAEMRMQVSSEYLLKEKNREIETNDSDDPRDTDKVLINLIESKKKETEAKMQKDSEDEMGNEKTEPETVDEIYINNAGLVLLHPFLPILFSKLNLTREDKWIDEDAQCKAMLILQFLADAQTVFPEYELPLNKILCDWPLKESFETKLEIDAFAQIACEELLEEVIQYWSRLKNTGNDALRKTFLCRMGKLSRANNGWLLQIEQKSFDVLLGGLPWSINVIKLPWMKEILYVEWM